MASLRRHMNRFFRVRTLTYFLMFVFIFVCLKSLTGNNTDRQTALAKKMPRIEKDIELYGSGKVFVPASLKKIDWHDYEFLEKENQRIGPGEQGYSAVLPSELQAKEKELYSVNGFNGALSDIISVNRSVRDIRHIACKTMKYVESLPTVSVVVPFHNEHWTTLLRTAHSVVNRSPDKLLREVILVDDASTKSFLGQELEDYLMKNLPKAKVVRLKKRSGLITARLMGAKAATSDVLVFLDSHTEANTNWLPPLLEPIALNYRTVVCPFIDVIAFDTFEYRAQDEGARGAFDWEFFYKRLPLLPIDERRKPLPFESPVMAGGLFAISRIFFWELGGYDPGLDIWGGEQYELSFKLWQCGGRMLDAPCSRVGHIYRKFAPFPNPGHGDFVGKNYRRVAEVWMDEYATYLYERRPHYLNIDPGDLTELKALRESLNCKPFRWFMHKVAFDLTAKYPPIQPSPFAEGSIKPETDPTLCVDMHHGNKNDILLLKACSESNGAEQKFLFTYHKDVKSKQRNMCWDLPESANKSPVHIYECHLGGGNQLWRYYPKTKTITQGKNDICLDWDMFTKDLFVRPCDADSKTQRWDIDMVDMDLLKDWDLVAQPVTGPTDY